MVGNPDNVRDVILDPAVGVLTGLRPGGVLVDCASSSPPALVREIAVLARVASCYAVDVADP
jgi:3-hydroxyisobutyrate dehydrogenase